MSDKAAVSGQGKKGPADEKGSAGTPWLIGVLFIVIAFWFAGLIITRFDVCKPEKFGEIGDAFNILNTLFSGLAFAGLIYGLWQQRAAIRMQSEEIRMQRQEIHLQIEESKSQTKEFEAQKQALQAQLIETSFSNALSLFYSRINDRQYMLMPSNNEHKLNRHVFFLRARSLKNKIINGYKNNQLSSSLQQKLVEYRLDYNKIESMHLDAKPEQSIKLLFFWLIRYEFIPFARSIIDMLTLISLYKVSDGNGNIESSIKLNSMQEIAMKNRLISTLSLDERELIKDFFSVKDCSIDDAVMILNKDETIIGVQDLIDTANELYNLHEDF